MFETSPTTGKLDAALAKAQGKIEAASKDKVNPAFRSKYADLTAVWAAIRPALSENGIAVTQWPVHSDDDRLHLITRLAHDGEWMKCEFSIPVMKPDSHGYGSATTYCKRFALAAAVGVVADEDDDGNGAAGKANGKASTHSPMDDRSPHDREMPPAKPTPLDKSEGLPGASKAKSRLGYSELVVEMRKAQTVSALDKWGHVRQPDIDMLPETWIPKLREDFRDWRAHLEAENLASG